jgi:hypothetical protein
MISSIHEIKQFKFKRKVQFEIDNINTKIQSNSLFHKNKKVEFKLIKIKREKKS